MAGAVLQLGQACVMVALVAASDDDVAAARLEAAGEWAQVAVSLLFAVAVLTLAARSCLRKRDMPQTRDFATSSGGVGNDDPDAPLLAIPGLHHHPSLPHANEANVPVFAPGNDTATPPLSGASLSRDATNAHGDVVSHEHRGPPQPSNPLLPSGPRRDR
uniref:Uncharacterized protein n=1 Tax=Neobodo designis TaxID=312471 RepID=A0A7S1MMI5_NEODS